MGKGFGELFKLRGIITYRLSPFHQKAFAGAFDHGLANVARRSGESLPYFLPPFIFGYLVYQLVETLHYSYMRKVPKDFENDC